MQVADHAARHARSLRHALTIGALIAARGPRLRGPALAAAIVLAATLTIDLSVNNGPSESTALPSSDL
jgi:hypothetical protein